MGRDGANHARKVHVLVTMIAVIASACGDGTLATSDNPVSELVATCGSVVFPTLSADPPPFPPLDEEAQAAFEEFVTGPLSAESGQLADAELAIASRSGDGMTLFGQQPGSDGFISVDFDRRDGMWKATSWGGCPVIISAGGFGSATTRFDPDIEPDPSSVTLNLVIQERDCASGLAPTDRDVVPVAIETDTRIEIVTLVEPIRGSAECPSNPWFPVTATLDAPLGDRVVVDAHMPPGAEISWPPNLDDEVEATGIEELPAVSPKLRSRFGRGTACVPQGGRGAARRRIATAD